MSGQQYQLRRDTRANVEAATPAQGEVFFVTDKGEGGFGDGATSGGLPFQRKNRIESLSPAQITADQNNYSPASFDRHVGLLILSTDAKRVLTGIAGGSTDRVLVIVNGGAQQLVLADGNSGSLTANRFDLNGDITLLPKAGVALFYNSTAARWQRASSGQKLNSLPEDFVLAGVITPAQITANQNDYAPVDGVTATKTFALASIVRLASDASRNITGMVDARDGAIKTIINVGTNPIVLKTSDAGSSAANRFDFGADITLTGKQSVTIRYDGADARWKLEASTAGSAIASGAVVAQTIGGSAFGMSHGVVNGKIVESRAGGAVTFALKTLGGTDPTAVDPVLVAFQDGAGGYVMRSITAALSLIVSSGSSLGFSAGVAGKLWITLHDTGAGVVMGIINCRSATDIYPLAGYGSATTTAEGGAGGADSAHVFYTAAALASPVPYVPVAYASYENGLAAAGTWNVAPSRIQLFGPSVPLPGFVVQSVRTQSSAVDTGTVIVPADDTIPQSSEGKEFLNRQITPSSAAHVLRVSTLLQVSPSTAAGVTLGLFQDAAANALAAVTTTLAAGYGQALVLFHELIAGGTAAMVFRSRAGMSVAGTLTMNGFGGARYMGGVYNSHLAVEEIAT